MITKEMAAVLALRVYEQDVDKFNLPTEPDGWAKLEIIISFRGTDGFVVGMMGAYGANNLGMALGQATSQSIQAAKVYTKVLGIDGSDFSDYQHPRRQHPPPLQC